MALAHEAWPLSHHCIRLRYGPWLGWYLLMALIPPLRSYSIWQPWPGLDKPTFVMHTCSAIMDMGPGQRPKAQGAASPPGSGPASPWALVLDPGPISTMAEHLYMINDAFSRPGQGCQMGCKCNGGIRAMSKHHPGQGPYQVRMQWWEGLSSDMRPRVRSQLGYSVRNTVRYGTLCSICTDRTICTVCTACTVCTICTICTVQYVQHVQYVHTVLHDI